jgi:hypothetical protein
MSSSLSSIRIVCYTDKSIVVVGDTKTYKDSLKNLGGKWNGSLTNKETGEKFMGWIFYASKKKDIQSWIDAGCQNIQDDRQPKNDESKQESKQVSKQVQPQPQYQSPSQPKPKANSANLHTSEDRIRQLEKTVELLMTKLASLEIEVKSLKGKKSETQTETQYETVEEFEEFEEVEEEIQVPKRRLLR